MSEVMEIVIAVVGAVGGWECIRYFVNRKNNARINDVEADMAEFKKLAETNQFLQGQLHDKEERFAEQTDRLRKVQDELFELMKVKSNIELELQRYRCVVPKCAKREPQNGY